MNNMNICIAGLGNVGSHLVSTIITNKKLVASKASISLNIVGISAKNKSKKRIFDINKFKWCDNPLDLLEINKCNVLVELIGDEKGLSFKLIKKALENKIHVVTANKALIAKNGSKLFEIAEKNNVLLLYEAAVAGGIPIIKTIKNNLFLNKVIKFSGIFNGTTNYILSKMYEENLTFEKVLKIAKSKGYTSDNEAPLDIGGLDAAHKLTILTSICFGSEISFDNNNITGIEDIKIEDIIYSDKLGYKIKLISESTLIGDKIYSVTGPKLLLKSKPLANVDGVLNAIDIKTDQLETLFLEGEGAGGKATASSVISDLYEIFSESKILSLGYCVNQLKKFKKVDIRDFESPYYLRFVTKDRAGVLSIITSDLKKSNISIEKILQLPESNDKNITIIITTHNVKKIKLLETIAKIEKQNFILEKVTSIPIDKN